MSSTPSFQQVLGQTQKALNAILDRELAATGLTEAHWVTLTVAEANEIVNQPSLSVGWPMPSKLAKPRPALSPPNWRACGCWSCLAVKDGR
jgi:hypothetical protein